MARVAHLVGVGCLLVQSAWVSRAVAGEAVVENGMFNLNFHFQYLPSPEDLTQLRAQVERARMQLCDATDGIVRIKKVTVLLGGANEEAGDVWILPQNGRSFSGVLGGHVTLMRESGIYTSGTIAHELGHYLMGLGDSYREDLRRFDGCGRGPNHDPGAFSPASNTIMQDSDSICRLADGRPLSDINPNWYIKCLDTCAPCTACEGLSDITTTCVETPLLASELSVDNNFDPLPGTGMACPDPIPASHFFVNAYFNPMAATAGPFSSQCGDGDLDDGEECDPNDMLTPRPRCEDFGLLQLNSEFVGCHQNCTFNKNGPCAPAFPADPCADTVDLPESCAPGGGVPPGATCEDFGLVSGSIFSCDTRCSLDLDTCETENPELCGNGIVDDGEQCDLGEDRNGISRDPALDENDQPVTCARFFGPKAGATYVRCGFNCSFYKADCNTNCAFTEDDPQACAVGVGEEVPTQTCQDFDFGVGEAKCTSCSLDLSQCGPAFDPTTFETARATSRTNSGWNLAVDGNGGVRSVRLFALPDTSTRWQVHAVGLGEDYQGRVPGTPVHLRTFRLTFDPTTHAVVSVQSGSGPDTPGTTGTMMLGGQPTDGTGEGSPPFVSQAPPLTLTVDFAQVSRSPWLQHTDTPGNPTGGMKFLAGTTISAGPSPTMKQVGACTGEDSATQCAAMWNGQSGSWEGTMHRWDTLHGDHLQPLRESGDLTAAVSDWRLLAETLPYRFPSAGFDAITVPDLPEPNPPTLETCGGTLDWVDTAVTSVSPDAIVLVLDRSHSMTTPIDANATYGTGTREPRMAFAQAAARDFLDLLGSRPMSRPQVGLVSFQTTTTTDHVIAQIAQAPLSGQVAVSTFKAIVDGLEPDGRTAIGRGLREAGNLFDAGNFMSKAIVLLSDGENNEPEPLGEFDPIAVANELRAKNIRVYTIPTGHAADKALLALIAETTGGEMFHAPVGDELPAVFAEAYARATGETLSMPRTEVSVSGTTRCEVGENPCVQPEIRTETPLGCMCVIPGQPSTFVTKVFTVEENATRLNVLLSVRNGDVNTWGPQFQLVDPNGVVVFDHDSPSVLTDDFYRVLTTLTPTAGTWTLHFSAIDLPDQHQFVQAHVEGGGPDCHPRVSRMTVDDTESVVVSATASYAGRAVANPAIGGILTRPDKSISFLAFGAPDASGERSAVIPPSLYDGRGIYEVQVVCSAIDGDSFALGEGATGPEDGDEGSRSPAFGRLASTAFFVNSDIEPPVPPGGDCDYNGIPDAQEAQADTDGDGLGDVCDEDDDADDIPDATDPDPKDSECQVPACPIANAGPDQIVQCSAPDTAVATLDGRASSDPDGQTLSFSWASSVSLTNANQAVATGTFPLGTTGATLTVSDGPNFASDGTLVTVLDTAPPVLTPPPDIGTPTCTGVNIGQATAVDACGGAVTIVNDAPSTFKAGTRVVTWRAIDRFGNVAVATQTIVVGLGNNKNCCPIGTKLKLGTSNNDTLLGTTGADCILGLGAQDVIKGLGGNDFLSGGDGDDVVEGGDGNDQVEGGSGQDTLRGGNGIDALLGNDGDDQCFGGPQDDRFHGGQGQDKLYGEDGNDRMFGEDGDDRLEGAAGNDLLNGGGLHDICIGGTGTNTFLLCEVQQ